MLWVIKFTLKSPNKRKVENWAGLTICNVVQRLLKIETEEDGGR